MNTQKKTYFEVERPTRIRKRMVELRSRGKRTSKGEPMSFAAIGRTLEPPVSRVTVYQVVDDKIVSARIREAIERELEECYWVRKSA